MQQLQLVVTGGQVSNLVIEAHSNSIMLLWPNLTKLVRYFEVLLELVAHN